MPCHRLEVGERSAAGGRQWAGAGTTGRSGRLRAYATGPERLQRVQRETHAWCGSTKIRWGLSMGNQTIAERLTIYIYT